MEFKIIPPLLNDNSCLNEHDKTLLYNLYEEEDTATWETVAGDNPLDERRLNRNHCTYDEMISQPKQIEETIRLEKDAIAETAKTLCKKKISRIYMVGCGDSLAALRGERYFMEIFLGIPCKEEDALDFAYYNSNPIDEETLVIVLSSSGRTIRVVEALLVAKARKAQTIAFTNTPGSPLAVAATASVLIHASRKGWPTQSSTAAMAALVQLVIEIGRCMHIEKTEYYESQFKKIPELMEKAIWSNESKIFQLAEQLIDKKVFFFCGGGPFYTCAEYGSAKVKEATPNYAVPVLLEEFHHYNTVKSGDPLFLIAPPGYSTYRGLETIWAGKQLESIVYVFTSAKEKALIEAADEAILLPEAEECFLNFVYAIPMQQFGYYLSVVMEKRARKELEK